MEQITQTYQNIILQSQKELHTVQQNIYYISLLRLILFISALTNTFIFWSEEWIQLSIFALLPFLLFIFLVKRHNKWFYQKEVLQKRIEINEQELQSLRYDFTSFEGGENYINPEHPYTYDLDIFGKKSLFQSINRTSTPVGKEHLAQWLNHHLTKTEEIEIRQEAIRELTPELTYRQQIRLLGLLFKGNPTDTEDIKEWATSISKFHSKKILRILPWCVGGINVLCFCLTILNILSIEISATIFVGFILFSTFFSNKITQFQTSYGKKLQILSTYAEQILLTEKMDWKSRALCKLRNELTLNQQSASQTLRELSQLMNTLDQRHNVLISSLLNGFIMWELIQVMRIEQWKERHAHVLPQWMEIIGEIEAYCSLATFAYNHPNYTYPHLTSQSFKLNATALGHPLMPANQCIKNDIHIEKSPSFIIITGANMAGKSTYLRTIGVNYLLACIGAPVWADQMTIYPAQLITSLRTTDSLTDNESYFFAELKRLKRIINLLQDGQELFIILDEILKGTNSMDKQKGSLALIKQFIHLRTNGLIATHDLLLGTLKDSFPQYIQNYCFEADIQNDELTFSYRMREGIAQNMNACFLMKKMGISGLE